MIFVPAMLKIAIYEGTIDKIDSAFLTSWQVVPNPSLEKAVGGFM